MSDMSMDEQYLLNIEKDRISKKVRTMEYDGEKRKRAFHDNKKLQEKIRKLADAKMRACPKFKKPIGG